MEDKKIAVLIDGENVNHKYIDYLFNTIRNDGQINITKLFCRVDDIKTWSDIIKKYSIEIVTQIENVKGKNTSDSSLIIEAMKIMYSNKVNTFYIITSDSDFTKLITTIRADDKIVVGVGEKGKTNETLVNACNKFIYLENLVPNEEVEKNIPNIASSDSLYTIYTEIERMINESPNGERQISQIMEKMGKIYPDFDLKNYDVPHKPLEFFKSIKGLKVFAAKDKTTYIAKIEDEQLFNQFIHESINSTHIKNELCSTNDEIIPNEKELTVFIRNFHAKNKEDNGYINISKVNENIKKKYPTFKVKNYGVSRFVLLLKKLFPNVKFNPKKTDFKI